MEAWLGDQDSNLDKQIQSLPCYRYTISQQREEQRNQHLILRYSRHPGKQDPTDRWVVGEHESLGTKLLDGQVRKTGGVYNHELFIGFGYFAATVQAGGEGCEQWKPSQDPGG